MQRSEESRVRYDLRGRKALVTGGSGGIGRAVATRLAACGAAVVVSYRSNGERAKELVREIRASGGRAAAVRADLASEEGPGRLVREAERALSQAPSQAPIDILVNAAGIGLNRLAIDTSVSEWRRVIDVNLQAAFLCAREVLPAMVRSGWGRIVNVGSIWGEVGAAGESVYSASKAGLHGLTKALAKEVARLGVTVNAVAPGVIETDMNAGFDDDERAALLARIPVGRFGSPDDVAEAVSFLCSDEAAYVTGHILWVTGGFDPLPD